MTVLQGNKRRGRAPAQRARRATPATGTATIFALSTVPGRAGVAVIRVSGPGTAAALSALTGGLRPQPRRATLAEIRDPESAAPIDQGLVIWFPGPRSFTGEDMAELHLHGGRAVAAGALSALGSLPGLRPAEPGEFTRRAFDQGKLDLSEVEGLADLIDAETEAQRRQALRLMEGGLSGLTRNWRDRLTAALAHLEAGIDFPEDDLPAGLSGKSREAVTAVAREIESALADGCRGERLRDGFYIALIGPPNAGKSSLLNALARRDVAIVSETEGTTRDVIEVHLDLEGFPVTLADTAGLRAMAEAQADDEGIGRGLAPDPVEAEGMRRSRARAESADLKIAIFDIREWSRAEGEAVSLIDDRTLVVLNKFDLIDESDLLATPGSMPIHLPGPARNALARRPPLVASVLFGDGLDTLLAAISAEVREGLELASTSAPLTRARHRAALEDCREALARAATAPLVEFAAEDLRLAVRALGRITGRVDVEDVLDIIFQDFCIGK